MKIMLLGKEGIRLKRRLLMLVLCVVMLGVIAMPASAESTASKVESFVTVNSDGDCLVALTVTLHLESAIDTLTFPLPPDATNITMNGSSVRVNSTGSATEVDVAKATGGLIGDFTVRFDYTIPEAVKVVPFETEDGEQSAYLQLQLPLLSGFSLPVDKLSFVITLPANIPYMPNFTSTYRQTSMESDLEYNVNGSMITGSSVVQIQDHDSVNMTLVVPNEMFPTISTYIRTGNPEVVPMLICVGVALLYWLLFCRTLPLIRKRSVSAPEGITAGEIGCHLTLAGGDLTMMVMTWAQLGYILIHIDGNRVMLHKRMDMGNERSQFEVKIYKALFGNRRMVDATGSQYTKLSRKVFATIPGERSLCKPNSGNMKIYRVLCCSSMIFCGICVAMNMTSVPVLQVLLSLILAAVGVVSAWQIHEISYRTHLRGKTRVYVGLVCVLIWVLLGILCGQWIIPTCAALGQWLLGYLAAYGGRRSELGRHDAGLILGLRSFLKHISKEDIQRLQKSDPDYFFNMAPYALAMGIIKPFAANFGGRPLDQCPYLVTRVHGKRSAIEWAELLAHTADLMDARYRRGEIEKWLPIRRG